MNMRSLKQPGRWLIPAVGVLIVLLYLLPACQSPPPQVTPTPTRTPRPVNPTTPAPIQVASPTPVVANPPTATPDARVQTEFPPEVNPLTGEKVDDPTVLNRRPLAVKISNYPPLVRPQQGLGQADLVFEHPAEGGVTRFTALFYGKTPELAGSVRSGRYLDLEIPQMYKAFFAYSGSSAGLKIKFQEANFFNRILSPDFGVPEGGDPFARIPQGDNKPFEHTLFAKPALLWKWAETHGMDNSRQDLKGMAFSDAPVKPGQAAAKLVIPVSAGDWAEQVEWTFDAASAKYLRSISGVPHTDAASGGQLAFSNVILVYAPHIIDCHVQEDLVGFEAACNKSGHFSRQIQLWQIDPNVPGGKVQIFRDGQMFEGYWKRAQPSDMLTFYFEDGSTIPLKRGASFFELLPLDFAVQAQ